MDPESLYQKMIWWLPYLNLGDHVEVTVRVIVIITNLKFDCLSVCWIDPHDNFKQSKTNEGLDNSTVVFMLSTAPKSELHWSEYKWVQISRRKPTVFVSIL